MLFRSIAIEVKSTRRVTDKDEKGLRALSEEIKLQRKIIVCNESAPRKSNAGVDILPIEDFLKQLWNGEIVG